MCCTCAFTEKTGTTFDSTQGSWIPEADEVLQGRLGKTIEVHTTSDQSRYWGKPIAPIYFSICIYIYIYGAASPTPPPPVDGSWSPPPPLWLWGCGGALLVSDAADFLWFLVPPPPVDVWMGHGGGGGAGSMYINIYVYMNISICICI